MLRERLFIEDEEECKKAWMLAFKNPTSFTLFEIRRLMNRFLEKKDVEIVISSLRKMVGLHAQPENEVEIRRDELIRTIRELRREEFANNDHIRYLYELLCERQGCDP